MEKSASDRSKLDIALGARKRGAVLIAFGLTAVLSGGISAQYAGWTIPDGGKEEKSPLKSSPDLVKKGKTLFTSNCQKCHGPLGKGDGPDSKKDEPAADLTDEFRYELNPEGVLYYKILNGHPPAMPAFKSTLSKDQIWTLVEYVKSLRKPQ
jgi:mono/diheme cytochrome c family protein